MRDQHPVFVDPLHNCYWVTRYDDITACYVDEAGFNTIPKGMSSGVLGNTQLELSGIEHRRRSNLYGRHLIGKALDRRLGVIKRLAAEMIGQWFDGTAPQGSLVHHDDGGGFSVELGKGFANEFPIRVVCQVLGFPDEARSQFVYWYSSMMNGLGGSERRTRASLPARIWRTSSKAWWTNDPSARPCCSTTTVNPSVPTSSRSSAPAGLTATFDSCRPIASSRTPHSLVAVRAAGFTGDSAALGDSVLDAILATTNGVTFTVEDHTDTWSRVRGGQVNLAIRRCSNRFPHGALRISPADGSSLGLADGEGHGQGAIVRGG